MKRSSSPENDDGPAQKRLTDRERQILEGWKQSYKQVDTSGTVIWSGTLKIPDSQKTVFDCSIKAHTQDEGIKSLLSLKQLTICIVPSSAVLSLRPYKVQSGSWLNLLTDENTDMMSYSAFSQAIRLGSDMRGCAVLKNSAPALHLLCVHSFSSGHENYIIGGIVTYQANDTVLGILRSHGLLPCANPEHSKERPMADMIKQLENWEHGRELLAQEHATMKKDLQLKDSMLQERKTKLTNMKMKLKKKKKQIMEKDKVQKELQHKYNALLKKNTELDEKLQFKDRDLVEQQELHQAQEEMIEEKEEEIVDLRQEVEEREEKLTRMENEIDELMVLAQEHATLKKDVHLKDSMLEERKIELTRMKVELEGMKEQIMEKDEALKKGQHKYNALLKKNTKLNEKLQFKDRDLVEQQGLHQAQEEMIEEKEEEIVGLRQKVEEREEKLTRMENEIEEWKKQIKVLPKKNARLKEELQRKDKILVQQQDLHHKEVEMLKMKMAQNTEEYEEKRNMMEEQIAERDRKIITLQMQMREVQCGKREIVTDMLEEFTCSICRNTLIKACGLPNCGHMFCVNCIDEWLQENTLCPLCRSEAGSPIECLVFDRFIENLLDHLGNEDKQKRINAVKDREERTHGRRLLEARVPEHSGRVSELYPSRESLTDSSDEENSSEAEEGEPQCREQEETRTDAFLSKFPTSLPLSPSSEDESM